MRITHSVSVAWFSAFVGAKSLLRWLYLATGSVAQSATLEPLGLAGIVVDWCQQSYGVAFIAYALVSVISAITKRFKKDKK